MHSFPLFISPFAITPYITLFAYIYLSTTLLLLQVTYIRVQYFCYTRQAIRAKKNRYKVNIAEKKKKKERAFFQFWQHNLYNGKHPILHSTTIRIHPQEIFILGFRCVYYWDLYSFKNWISKWIHACVNTAKQIQNPRTTQIVQHQAGALSENGASTSVLLGGIGKLLLWKSIGEQHVRYVHKCQKKITIVFSISQEHIKPQIGIIY